MPRNLLLMLVGLATAVTVRSALSQSVVRQLAVFAGNSTDARGVQSTTLTAAPRLVFFPLSPTTLALSANGNRFGGDAWQAGADAALSSRTPSWGGARLTANAMSSFARTSYDVTLIQNQATPALEWSVSALTLFGGMQYASGSTRVRGPAATPTPNAPVVLTSVTRSARGPVFGAEWAPTSWSLPLVASYRDERTRIVDEWVHDRTAAATIAWGPVSVGGSAGRRESPSENASFWSGSATMRLMSGVFLQGGVGRYPSMRLTGSAAGRYATVGLVFASDVLRGRGLPRPTGIAVPRSGITRLSLRAPDARRVEIAGDWNGWRRVPAQRAANGVWYIDLPLTPGEYRYAFRVDDSTWRVPEEAVVSDDGFGGKAAYITVAATATPRSSTQEDR